MNGANLDTMDKEAYAAYHRAEQKVKVLKDFYRHILVFALSTLCLLAGRYYLLPMLGMIPENEDTLNWLDLNVYLVPALWVIVLLIHGLWVYNFRFKWLKDWEERKLREFMEEESPYSNSNNTHS